MSAIGTYKYSLAKFLVPILQPLTSNQYTVNSSFSFVKEITSTSFPHSTVMISFDVSSLFTNISLDETVNIILDSLFSEINTITSNGCSFTRAHFKKLLEIAVKDNCIFNNQLYEQIDGVAMGSPLGPAFANIFMCALEKKFLSNCPSDFKPLLYRRYVDDTFCIFENNSQAQCFLQYVNCQHPNISFTHESEDSNSLPFLDVMVTHSDNTFSTNLYRRKTFTGLYTNFDSLSPIQYKINLISVLIYRAYHICSSYLSFHEQVCSIKRFLQQNQFPIYLINRIIKNFLDRQYSTINKLQNVPKLPVLILLPYLGVYSIRLKKNLNQFLGKIYPHIEFKFVFQPAKCIGSFFSCTDRAPSHIRSSVVYKCSCSSCKATYYGKTSRHFIVRCREHLGVNKKGKSIKGAPSSIRDHIVSTGHSASINDFCIINTASNELDLLIHESLLILRDRPTLNQQNSSIPLCLF